MSEKESDELTSLQKFMLLAAVALLFFGGIFVWSLFSRGSSEPNYGNCETIGNPTPCSDMPDPDQLDKTIEDINRNYPDDSH